MYIIYTIVLIVFFISTLCMLFAKDSYINKELTVYQETLRNPWLDRIVVLAYNGSRSPTNTDTVQPELQTP